MFTNVAAYHFVHLEHLKRRKKDLRKFCLDANLMGTILLSPEGINLFVAGTQVAVDSLLDKLRSAPELADLTAKFSQSDHQPFNRMLVKIKREIIAFGVAGIHPAKATSPKLKPQELHRWFSEGRDFQLLDVRNDYEIDLGTFRGATSLSIDHFRDFPQAVDSIPEHEKDRPLVMFCTGGIRCEKAGPLMERKGFRNVYQLDGGILKYFEECGGEYYDGECFVFDQRVALDSQLRETETKQCFACQSPVTKADQQSDQYVPGKSCPRCYRPDEVIRCESLANRNEQLYQLTHPLPGSQAYTNIRPIHIPASASGMRLWQYLQQAYPYVEASAWKERFDRQLLKLDGKPVGLDHVAQVGQRYEHWFPGTLEPDVNGDVRILYEDDALVVVNKPAPLPMHPCGRFNRNSLNSILNTCYGPQKLRLAHRLDANTSGVVIFSRTKKIASRLQPQFAAGDIKKGYLCGVVGLPPQSSFESTRPLSEDSLPAGARSLAMSGHGLSAETQFDVLRRVPQQQVSYLEARPITGRTNQIRIHLWDLGWPIVGDPMYLPDGKRESRQTLGPADPPMQLHAHWITIRHPVNGNVVTFHAPLPEWAKAAGCEPRPTVEWTEFQRSCLTPTAADADSEWAP